MNKYISSIIQLFSYHWNQKPVKYSYSKEYNVPDYILIDHKKFQIIFINIFSNAVKYTFSGQILVTQRIEDGLLSTTISDSGIGMDVSKLSEMR